MSSLKARRIAKAISEATSGKKGKKPRSQASIEASKRQAEKRRKHLLNRETSRTVSAKRHLSEKRKARREDMRKKNREAHAHNKAVPLAKRVEIPFPNLGKRPPEPMIFVWMDWFRISGNIMHCGRGHGRKARKWRLNADKAWEVGADRDGRQLVRMPLHVALDVFGKA